METLQCKLCDFLLFCGLYQACGMVLAGLEKPDITLTGGGRTSLGRDPVGRSGPLLLGEEWAGPLLPQCLLLPNYRSVVSI